MGLGADGYGKSSMIGANAAGAFIAEVVLTFVFVLVILAATRRASNATVAGLVILADSVEPAAEEQAR